MLFLGESTYHCCYYCCWPLCFPDEFLSAQSFILQEPPNQGEILLLYYLQSVITVFDLFQVNRLVSLFQFQPLNNSIFKMCFIYNIYIKYRLYLFKRLLSVSFIPTQQSTLPAPYFVIHIQAWL